MQWTLWRHAASAPRLILPLALTAALPQLYGFVLLGNQEARLPATPANPTITFVWDGQAPNNIKDKDKYQDGRFANASDTELMAQLLTDAMSLWNNVPGSYLKLAFKSGTAVDDPSDQQHSIMVKKDSNLSTAAYAKPVTDPNNSAVIYDCDVHINDTSTAAADLAYTIAHELGHCVGLGHAHTNYGAMMGYSRAMRSMTLGQDDRAGIIYLYQDPAFFSQSTKELVACGNVVGRGGMPGRSALLTLSLYGFPLVAAALYPLASGGHRRQRRRSKAAPPSSPCAT